MYNKQGGKDGRVREKDEKGKWDGSWVIKSEQF